MKKIILALCLSFFTVINISNAAISDWQKEFDKAAQVRILGSFYKNEQNQKIDYKNPIIGVEFRIGKGWKIYGKESGDFGIEPTFNFSKNSNYLSHKVIWPKSIIAKETFGDTTYEYSVYKGSVIIPINLNLKKIKEVQEIKVRVDFGLCKDICIPASKDLVITLDKQIDFQALKLINKYYDNDLIAKDNFSTEKSSSTNRGVWFMLMIAIIGGAVLNIMPCVLPVLSIKLLSIINHTTAEISKIRYAFLATIFGILTCFVFFSLAAIIIKVTGNSLGWGLQFQNPYFLVFLIVILVFFTANLLEVFEINFSSKLTNLINQKIIKNQNERKIFITNYLSGILAVLLATPCSAPFLGSAISFALIQNYAIIILMFLAIGFGFALPYIILIFTPKLIYLLPKPGKWMDGFKQLMSGFLMATIIWLVYVLIGIIGNLPAYIVSFIAVMMVACLRIKRNILKISLISLLIVTLFSLPFYLKEDKDARVAKYNSIWQNFVENDIEKYVKQGKVVVIDVTADWCVTCKINKIRVLENNEVLKVLKQTNIIAMQADITRPRREVMEYLAKKERYAIPFNAVYGPNAKNGILTSELLTKKELLEAIQQAK